MKSISITLIALMILCLGNSCRKCGYCDYGAGYVTDTYCQPLPHPMNIGEEDEYKSAKNRCVDNVGIWYED